jgi:MoxR-like ATPase
MSSSSVYSTLIERYKRKLADIGLGNEAYKWEWIQAYKGRPDLDAEDFVRDFQLITRTNLIYQISSAVLVRFAKLRPNELKGMLTALYDEGVDLQNRIDTFRQDSETLFAQIRSDPKRNSHQDERTISALLALRYPDIYPIYKEGLYQKLCNQLGRTLSKPGSKYVDYIYLIKEFIGSHIRPDTELIDLVRSELPENAYSDPNFLLLAQDILYQNYEGGMTYDPGAVDPSKPRYWLLSPGKNASHWAQFKSEGIAALDNEFAQDVSPFDSIEKVRQAVGAKSNSDRMNLTLSLYEFAHVMKPGDYIIAKKGLKSYIGVGIVESEYQFEAGKSSFPHVRKVEWVHDGSWQDKDQIVLKALTDITKYPDYVRKLKALIGFGDTDIEDETEITTSILPTSPRDPYTLASATSGNFLDPDWLSESLELWLMKKNLILQGPPGTGKTFVAKRLAWLLMGEKDESRLHLVQFHPSYSYEDFIEGYRPDGKGGFALRSGHFLSFCRRAESDPNRPYVFVIDEINRGNLSKVFGEVMMGIEADKRGERIHLQYGKLDEPFSIPKNVHLIGTMNTADRSLALVDYALRRRFAFKTVSPEFGPRFKAFLMEQNVSADLIARISSMMEALNADILGDSSLGTGYAVGHSYFCAPPTDSTQHENWLNRIWRYEVVPLMEEYWFDQTSKVDEVKRKLGVS